MSRLRRIAIVLGALALPLVAVLEVAGELAVVAGVPTEGEWEAAVTAARSMARPGEPVIVAPAWAEPHARARLGDDATPLAHVARADTDRFPGAVQIGLDGAHAPELATFRPAEERQVGPFVVRRVENPAPDVVVWDLVEHFRPPTASVLGTDPPISCAWSARSRVLAGGLAGHPTFPRERFECAGGPSMGAGVTVITDQDFRPRRCLWAHPFPRGEKVLRFERAPLGKARRLVGHHGMYGIVERNPGGAATELEVRVDGVSIGRDVRQDGEGWKRFAFDLPAVPGEVAPQPSGSPPRGTAPQGSPSQGTPPQGEGRVGTIDLVITTTDAEHRHLCVEATLR